MGQKHRHKLRGISCVRFLMKLISIIFVVVDEESVILGQTSQPLPSPALNVVKVLCYEDATEAAIAAKTSTQYATVMHNDGTIIRMSTTDIRFFEYLLWA
jgi:hypothetical protein